MHPYCPFGHVLVFICPLLALRVKPVYPRHHSVHLRGLIGKLRHFDNKFFRAPIQSAAASSWGIASVGGALAPVAMVKLVKDSSVEWVLLSESG